MSEKKVPNSDILPAGLIAQEFSANGEMDDFDAFMETFEPDQHEEIQLRIKSVVRWRAAKCVIKLRRQIDQCFSNRDRSSDGIMGDSDHCPGSSDHCPNIIDGGVGIVTAIDITHDPASGCDLQKISRLISEDGDSRIKYIIFDHQICRSYPWSGRPAWTWQTFSGGNPHTKHAHFSVLSVPSAYDEMRPWRIL